MEISVCVLAPELGRRPRYVLIRWHGPQTVRDLRRELCAFLGMEVHHLAIGEEQIADDIAVGMAPIVEGAELRPQTGAREAPRSSTSLMNLAVISGPDAGRSVPVTPGVITIGRSPGNRLSINDATLSRRHAAVSVDGDAVEVSDVGSENGMRVDGVTVERQRIGVENVVSLGATRVALRRRSRATCVSESVGDGFLTIHPAAAPPPAITPVTVQAPRKAETGPRPSFPWLTVLAPIPVAGVMALLFGPRMLAFAAMAPIMALAAAVAERRRSRHAAAARATTYLRSLTEARHTMERGLDDERRVRCGRTYDPARVRVLASERAPGLWSAGDTPLRVRLGIGATPSTATWVEEGTTTRHLLRDVPVDLELTAGDVVVIVGVPVARARVIDALAAQVVTVNSPVDVGVIATGPAAAWLRLTPHAREPGLARTLVRVMDGARHEGTEGECVTIVGVANSEEVPVAMTHLLTIGDDGSAVLTSGDGTSTLVPDGIGASVALTIGRALAPLRPPGGGPDGAQALLTLADARGHELTPAAIRRGWDSHSATWPIPGPFAAGSDGQPATLDLDRDGPHILIGGTTGSGKSVLLQTLVCGLAVSAPPDELGLILVDYKGGAAFAGFAPLPHVLGQVTDLDDHLVARALTSLHAELRRRERLFGAVGASNLAEYRFRRGPEHEVVVRLVIVIDEFKALIDELPEFVAGIVRIAALGRSLGIHLILATQRPSGAITPEIRANVAGRMALRMREAADSLDVLDDPGAAALPRDQPGRGYLRGEDGLIGFRAVLASARRTTAQPRLEVSADPRFEPGAAVSSSPTAAGEAPDIDSVVDAVRAAHRGRGPLPTHRPWLAPLPQGADLKVDPAAGEVGLIDDPARQEQRPLVSGRGVTAVVGPRGSGASTALLAALAVRLTRLDADPCTIQVISDDARFAELRDHPWVGTVAGSTDEWVARRIVGMVADRVGGERDQQAPGLLLIIDGLERILDLDPAGPHGPLADDLRRIMRDGPSRGVDVLVSGGRLLRSASWAAAATTTWALGPPDPLDAGPGLGPKKQSVHVDAPPGRGHLPKSGLEFQIAPLRAPTTSDRQPEARDHPVRVRPLPARATREGFPGSDAPYAIGVGGDACDVVAIAPESVRHRFAILGPPGSGRTTCLAALAASIPPDRMVALIGGPGGAPAANRPHEVAVTAEDPGPLVALRREHPDLIVLVDDADRLAGGPLEPVLTEIGDLAQSAGGFLVVASSAQSVLGRLRGVDVEAARGRHGLLLNPQRGDGEALGTRIPPGLPTGPGRGLLVTPRDSIAAQVFTC